MRYLDLRVPQALNPETKFPFDWDLPPDNPTHRYESWWHGVYPKPINHCYHTVVRCGGRPHFIGASFTRYHAALLYDLGIWRFAPKSQRRIKPNFPDSFGGINYNLYLEILGARTAQRLDSEFEKCPWAFPGDEKLSLDALLARALKGLSPTLSQRYSAPYRDAIMHIRATMIDCERLADASFKARAKLGAAVFKVPVVDQGLTNLEIKLKKLAGVARELCKSADEHAEVYAKAVKLLADSGDEF